MRRRGGDRILNADDAAAGRLYADLMGHDLTRWPRPSAGAELLGWLRDHGM